MSSIVGAQPFSISSAAFFLQRYGLNLIRLDSSLPQLAKYSLTPAGKDLTLSTINSTDSESSGRMNMNSLIQL